jgi:hypothetical protein
MMAMKLKVACRDWMEKAGWGVRKIGSQGGFVFVLASVFEVS